MGAGDRSKRLTILKPVTTTNSEGEPVVTWAPGGKVWASVRPLTATEKLSAAQLQQQVTHQIVIPYRTDVTHQNRLTWGSRTFDVLTASDRTEDQVELELTCQELVD